MIDTMFMDFQCSLNFSPKPGDSLLVAYVQQPGLFRDPGHFLFRRWFGRSRSGGWRIPGQSVQYPRYPRLTGQGSGALHPLCHLVIHRIYVFITSALGVGRENAPRN